MKNLNYLKLKYSGNFFNKLIKYNYSSNRRVVVTGMGLVSPLGNKVKENWDNLINYKSGIRNLSEEEYGKELPSNCKIGATIRKDFDSKKYRTLV